MRECNWMCNCIFKAAREEGLNEGIRAMFSAGLGGALMKVGFLPFLILFNLMKVFPTRCSNPN